MDYSFVPSTARIALYDDLLSSPQIIEVPPAETMDFIGALAAEVYNRSRDMGGAIPFSAIKQVTENLIHADFREIVVSIMDSGNTIRFADQGPGIPDKQRAQLPGFSSATEPMKRYIDGVGSGLPIVREYLDVKHGTLTLDDNLNGGSVITLSLTAPGGGKDAVSAPDVADSGMMPVPTMAAASPQGGFPAMAQDVSRETLWAASPAAMSGSAASSHTATDRSSAVMPGGNAPAGNAAVPGYPAELVVSSLSPRARQILSLFDQEDTLGVQDISTMTGIPLSSTHAELRRLEEAGLIEKIGRKRMLSQLGRQVGAAL